MRKAPFELAGNDRLELEGGIARQNVPVKVYRRAVRILALRQDYGDKGLAILPDAFARRAARGSSGDLQGASARGFDRFGLFARARRS